MSDEESDPHKTENPEFSDELIGQTFGVYRITREIGRGGMGVVYLAQRVDGFFRQDVAIKFVKRGMDTDSILKRFRNERQILATLSHLYLTTLAAAYVDAGEREKAFEIMRRLDEISKTRFVSEYMVSLIYCALGDKDQAFENLEKSLAGRDGWLNWTKIIRRAIHRSDSVCSGWNALKKPYLILKNLTR